MKLWDASTGDLIHTFTGHEGRIPWVCFSPDGTRLASCDTGGDFERIILLHDIPTKRSFELFSIGDVGIRALAFSPDGRLLASGSDDRRIRLWDVATRSLIGDWEAPPYDIFSLDFHPAGRLLASAGRGDDVTLWDTANPSAPYLATLRGNNEMVFSVQFHPDGRHLISGGTATAVRVWDLTHYARHIAGNRQYQAERLRATLARTAAGSPD